MFAKAVACLSPRKTGVKDPRNPDFGFQGLRMDEFSVC